MKNALIAIALLATACGTAWAEDAAPARPPQAGQVTPAIQALGIMLQEAQGREAAALVQVFTLRAENEALRKRAEAAEQRAPKPEAPAPASAH